MVYKFFYNKNSTSDTSGGAIESTIAQNRELTKEIHEPVIRKFEKLKVHSSFICNIRGANIVDI